MLPKGKRADKKTIAQIFKAGKFVGSQNITFKYLKFAIPGGFKISFIVPKAVSRSAVVRNSLRRQGYLALQKNIHLIPSDTAGVFIFSKKKSENIENEIKNILSKVS
jgi:ribonuclease P protein component